MGRLRRAVLVTTCEMDAAVAYTFDGEAYVRDIWEEVQSRKVGARRASSTTSKPSDRKHRDGDGRHKETRQMRRGRTPPPIRVRSLAPPCAVRPSSSRSLRADRQRRHGPTMGCSHCNTANSITILRATIGTVGAAAAGITGVCTVHQVGRVESQVQRRQPVQRWWRSEQRRRWPERRWRTRSSLTINRGTSVRDEALPAAHVRDEDRTEVGCCKCFRRKRWTCGDIARIGQPFWHAGWPMATRATPTKSAPSPSTKAASAASQIAPVDSKG